MPTSDVNLLTAGVQQLYNKGLLPSSLNSSVLNNASASQLGQLASSSIALQESAALLGIGTSPSDSATLSSTAADAFAQEINPSSTSSSSDTDPLTQAINNALTSNLDAAVKKFLPASPTTSGQINLLG